MSRTAVQLASSNQEGWESYSRLYLHIRSDLQGAPVLISPVLKATAKSAMYLDSVSPDRC